MFGMRKSNGEALQPQKQASESQPRAKELLKLLSTMNMKDFEELNWEEKGQMVALFNVLIIGLEKSNLNREQRRKKK